MSKPIAFRPRQTPTPFSPSDLNDSAFPFQIRIVMSDIDRNAAFALRYRAYRALGYVAEDASGLFVDGNDAQPSTVVFGAYQDGTCIGTLRVSFSHPWHTASTLPCAPHYPEVLDLKRTARGPVVEMSRLAIDPNFSNTSYRTTLFAALVRTGFLAAQAGEVSNILIATKPEWSKFYSYMLGFKIVGKPAAYPPGDHRIVLLAGSFSQAELRQSAQNAFFKITPDEIASMKAALGPVLEIPIAASDNVVALR